MAEDKTKTVDTGLRSLMMHLKLLEIPFSVENLKHRLGKDEKLTKADILYLAKDHLKLKAKIKNLPLGKIQKLPLPAIAELNDHEFCLILKADHEKIHVQNSKSFKAETYSLAEFSEKYSGTVILITSKLARDFLGDFDEFGLSWFVKAFFKYQFTSVQIVFASVLMQIFIMITPLFTMVIIDKVLSSSSTKTLDVLILALGIITLFDFFIGQVRSYLLHMTSNKVDVYSVSKLFEHLLSLPLAFFKGKQTGDTISRVKEIESIRSFITGSALTTVIDFPFSFLLLMVMFFFSKVLAIIVCIAVILAILVYVVVGPIMKKKVQQKQQDSTDTQSFLYETVSSIETIKSLSVETRMQKVWEKQLISHAENNYQAEKINNRLSSIAGFLNKGTVAVCLYIGALAVIDGDMTAGQLIAFNMLVGRVMGPAQRLAQIFQQLKQVQTSAGRVKEIFQTKAEPALHSTMISLPKLQGNIRFDQISFKYNMDSPPVLENISFEVLAGQVVGIIGRTGSGKSSLVKLIQRLYSPIEGRIFIDGINIAEINPNWFRKNIGMVLQDNILLNRSIRENISLANPSLTLEQIEQAAILSGADEFIRKLPQVYDTIVGERGAMISAGQRQRIALARALVNNPKILILDEATSALDYESEQIIQKNMVKICQGRTVFIVAHRFSTLRITDRILTLDNGKIIEDGSMKELLQQKGAFYHLYQLQNIDYLNTVNKTPAKPGTQTKKKVEVPK